MEAFEGVLTRMRDRYRAKGVHCKGSIIPPAAFIPAAELHRMITQLNRVCQMAEERGESTDAEMADLGLNLAILSVLMVLTVECAPSGRDG